MLRLRFTILAALALSAAGCGGAASPSTDAPSPAAKVAPGPGGLRVTATDGRVGDATRADEAGTTQLKVPTRSVVPGELGRRSHRHGVGAGAACTDVDLLPDGGNVATIEAATLCLLNGERADAGLPPLTTNAELAAAALEHSQDMVSKQYFDHMAIDGRDVVARVDATGYIPLDRRWTVGENLAWGTGILATPKSIVAAWMASQGHKENILRPEFREIGFGIVLGNPRSTDGAGATYTTNFGAVSGQQASRQVASADTRRAAARRAARRRAARRRAARRSHAARARATRARHHRAVRARISLGPTKRRAVHR
jgi:uncharacterized protein YkwD